MIPRIAVGAAGVLTAALAAVLTPLAATAAEVESDGVRVDVEITPRECVVDCGGGVVPPDVPAGPGVPGLPGLPHLPATGYELPLVGVWLAALLVAAGIALIVLRRANAVAALDSGSPHAAPNLYHVDSGSRRGVAPGGPAGLSGAADSRHSADAPPN